MFKYIIYVSFDAQTVPGRSPQATRAANALVAWQESKGYLLTDGGG